MSPAEVERSQGNGQADHGAVRVGDQRSRPPLFSQQHEVIRVHLGNDEGHAHVHPMAGSVAHHHMSLGSQIDLQGPSHTAWKGGEQDRSCPGVGRLLQPKGDRVPSKSSFRILAVSGDSLPETEAR